jgi:hypothetical protein
MLRTEAHLLDELSRGALLRVLTGPELSGRDLEQDLSRRVTVLAHEPEISVVNADHADGTAVLDHLAGRAVAVRRLDVVDAQTKNRPLEDRAGSEDALPHGL